MHRVCGRAQAPTAGLQHAPLALGDDDERVTKLNMFCNTSRLTMASQTSHASHSSSTLLSALTVA